jgi:hypothetical protein
MAITFDPNDKFLHEFTEAIFVVVVMELLLGEEEVWSARLY